MSNVVKFPRRPPPPPPPEGGALMPRDRLQALMAAAINEDCAEACRAKASGGLRKVFEQNARLFRYFAEVAYGSQR